MTNITWSFSRLNTYLQCPFQYKTKYIDGQKGIGNFFSDFGSLVHSLIESYCKGECETYDLSKLFKEKFKTSINFSAPPNDYVDLNKSYYNKLLTYFDNFTGFAYPVIAVEKEVRFDIDGLNVVGFIDLILQGKKGLILLDHKSKSIKTNTSDGAEETYKQLSLYSLGIKDEYGTYPARLAINAFKENKKYIIDFDIKRAENIKLWVKNTVKKIEQDEEFLPCQNDFFCSQLCNFRETCIYRG